MWQYALKRIVWTIPTVGVILFLSFYLQSLGPGDPIAEYLELDGFGRYAERERYQSAYRDIYLDQGFDLPSFYWTVRPSYFPDTLRRVTPLQKQRQLTQLVRYTKDWAVVASYDRALQEAIQSSTKETPDLSHLLHLDKSISITEIMSQDTHSMSPEREELISAIRAIKPGHYWSLPVISWHGTNNQFHRWMKALFSTSNRSLIDGKPARAKVFSAMWWTITLSLITLLIIAALSLILAYWQVWYGGWLDKISSSILYILLAVPTFWLASLLVMFFTTSEYGAWTNIFPSIGIKPSYENKGFMSELMLNAQQLILPIICLVLAEISYITLQVRSDLTQALRQPYVLTAKAKGLRARYILRKHALPNALLPYITILSGAIPSIFTGSVIIEVIFNIPGVGYLMLHSVQQADWPVVFTIILILSLFTIMGYLLGDLLIARLYPKSLKSFQS